MPLTEEKRRRYTYDDILARNDGKRYEMYHGRLVALASPTDIHQEISLALCVQFYNYLLGKRCRVYPAPYDVFPFAKKGENLRNITTVVQPDISVVCDEEKRSRRGCIGAPDLIVEILSPSTERADRFVKLNLYRRAGVKEYWIADPIKNTVSVYLLEGRHYCAPVTYGADAEIPVSVLEDCKVNLKQVFREA